MANIRGLDVTVDSWTNNTHFISGGQGVQSASLNLTSDEQNTSILGTIPQQYIPGLRNWSGTLTNRINPAALGLLGSVTFATGYVVRAFAWTMNIDFAIIPNDEFDLDERTRTYETGEMGWSGTYSVNVDDTTFLNTNANWWASDPAAATFLYKATHTLGGNIMIGGHSLNIDRASHVQNEISYRGSGALAAVGASNPLFPDGDVFSAPGEIQMTLGSGPEVSGTAIPTSVAIVVPYQAPVTVTVNFQGSGPLSIEAPA